MKRLVNRLSGACLYVLLALIVGMSSCEDDANDWTVNKNYDALFRPLTFGYIKIFADCECKSLYF